MFLPGIAIGLELLVRTLGLCRLLGLADLRGVSGGVTPLPFALDSPIAFTRSFTDTPDNSAGISLSLSLSPFASSLFSHLGKAFFFSLRGTLGDSARSSPNIKGFVLLAVSEDNGGICAEVCAADDPNVNGLS